MMLVSYLKGLMDSAGLPKERKKELKELCKKLNINIWSLSLLDRALTHSSFYEKVRQHENYERLEFLGDSILNASVSYMLFTDNPMFMEGKMSSLRASLVDELTLSKVGIELGIPKYIKLGRGETLSDSRALKKVTADVMESIIAVVFLEKGFKAAMNYCIGLLTGNIKNRMQNGTGDYKTILQKISIDKYKEYPVYNVINETGPDHNKMFTIEVVIKDKIKEVATGRSKKSAEKIAAGNMLRKLGYLENKNKK